MVTSARSTAGCIFDGIVKNTPGTEQAAQACSDFVVATVEAVIIATRVGQYRGYEARVAADLAAQFVDTCVVRFVHKRLDTR